MQLYKELRLRALREEPQAFGSSYEANVNKPDSYWVERLNDVKSGNGWLVFAEINDKLVGMNSCTLLDSTHETHHTLFGTERKFVYCYCRKD